jgi:hypothetical protein
LDIFDPEVAGGVFLDSSFFKTFPKHLLLLSGQFNWLARSWTSSQAIYALGIKAMNSVAGLRLFQSDGFNRLGHGAPQSYQSHR